MNIMARRQPSKFGGILKHEARLNLWLPALMDLKNEVGRPLKYFTLPGENAYDVIRWKRAGLLEYTGKGFPGVRFCDFDPRNYGLAKKILGDTPGLNKPFEEVIRGSGNEAYRAFWDLFPYDVYNLDFCGTGFEQHQSQVSDTFTSIVDLIKEHIKRRKSSKCLIFLTFRIDEARTNKIVIADWRSNLQSNREIGKFTSQIDSLIGDDIDDFVTNQFHDFALVSIPKLIAFNVLPQGRGKGGRLEDLARACYLREDYYIGKFVFYVEKEQRNSLRLIPDWYLDFVRSSLKLQDVLRFTKASKNTEDDLQKLKADVNKIES